jgi:hypothetical protein
VHAAQSLMLRLEKMLLQGCARSAVADAEAQEDAAAADVHAAQSLTLKLEKMLLLQMCTQRSR